VGEIETQIRVEEQRLLRSILTRLLMVVLFGGLSMGIIALTGRRLGRHFRADHGIFMHYFADAAVHGLPIDIGTLRIEEYQHIAALINDMVERKAELDAQLKIGLEERSVLLREVHHRVKNNFQMTASLLSMQKDLCADGSAQKALQTAHDRIYSMASVHNMFYQSNSFSNIDIGTYLSDIIANIRQSYNRESCTVRIVHEIEPFDINLERAIPLGLIINELITNSYKHAFPGRTEGTIRLTIGPENGGRVVVYSDDGIGVAAAPDQVQGKGQDEPMHGLGMELIKILMGQLGGTFSIGNGGGYRVVLRFPG